MECDRTHPAATRKPVHREHAGKAPAHHVTGPAAAKKQMKDPGAGKFCYSGLKVTP